jgi:membrane protein YdbS with pleckstrin-like domain
MKKNENKKLGKAPFIIAWMSFIPVFGIFFALIAIMILLSTEEQEGKKKLSIIAAVGFIYSIIVVTIFLYMELQRYTVAST